MKIICFAIVSFVVSFYMAVFVPIADDEKAEKTQLTVLLSRCLVSSFPQPLNHSPFFSNLPYFSLVANPTSPWLLILYLHHAVVVSCLILRRSAAQPLTYSSLISSHHFQGGCLSLFFFFTIFT
jgi:hypothetical protein